MYEPVTRAQTGKPTKGFTAFPGHSRDPQLNTCKYSNLNTHTTHIVHANFLKTAHLVMTVIDVQTDLLQCREIKQVSKATCPWVHELADMRPHQYNFYI